MLLDHCSATQYRYAMPKVGHLSPALTKAANDRDGVFELGAGDGGHLTGGKWPIFGVA